MIHVRDSDLALIERSKERVRLRGLGRNILRLMPTAQNYGIGIGGGDLGNLDDVVLI